MTALQSAALLLFINLGLLWLLMRIPLGVRTIRLTRTFQRPPEELWRAIDPAGTDADWHHSVISSKPLKNRAGIVEQIYSHLDREGAPLRRLLVLEPLPAAGGRGFRSRVADDSTLDLAFWRDFSESRIVRRLPDGAEIEITQTDRYRGLAFLLFRYVMLRRELRALEGWLETGASVPQGYFEHPTFQCGLAILSTFLLWPFFGLTTSGLMISTFLTLVIALHELGHLAAYRTFGHESVRMIFVPLLGGIAIGGRPYKSHFEVATCALMGPGISAFFVPILIAGDNIAAHGLLSEQFRGPLLIFLLILGAFNLLNLLPMQRFDGGQVLRQIFRTPRSLIGASFAITACILVIGWEVGVSSGILAAALAVFILLSMIGAGSLKPRHKLEEMKACERLLVTFGLYAAILIHGYAVIFSAEKLF